MLVFIKNFEDLNSDCDVLTASTLVAENLFRLFSDRKRRENRWENSIGILLGILLCF